jgi:hypothetical protein
MFLDVSSSLDAQNVNIDTQDVKIDTQNAKIDAQNIKIDSLNAKIVDQNSKIELRDCFSRLLERTWLYLMAGQKNWGG